MKINNIVSLTLLLLLLLVIVIPVQVLAADTKKVSVVNNSGQIAADLHIIYTGTGGSIIVDSSPSVKVNPDTATTCGAPTVPSNTQVTNEMVIDWGESCVDSGAEVTFTVSSENGPLAFNSGFWTNDAGGDIGQIGAGDITVEEDRARHCPETHLGHIIREENVDGIDGIDKLVREQEDQNGNKVETWCLNGSRFGKAYLPKGGTRVWFGKCPPPGGRNRRNKCASAGSFDAQGRPPGWDKLSYLNNESYDTDTPLNGLDDWHWVYFLKAGKYKYKDKDGNDAEIDVPAGKLVTRKTLCEEVDAKGYCKPGKDKTVGDPEIGDPPAKPGDLSFGGSPIDPPDEPHYDIEEPIISVVLMESSPTEWATEWEYALKTPSNEVFLTEITQGDTFTIYGCDIQNAYVTGDALYSINGAWQVAIDDNQNSATWIATTDSSVTGDSTISGFRIETLPAQAGQVGWKTLGGICYNDLVMGPKCPTLIQLVSFTATEVDGDVLLEWVTASEIDNAGFNIWRKEGEDGEYVKINDTLIPAKGSPTAGAYYSYTDDTVIDGNTYYYRLEDIDTNGTSTFHDETDPVIMGAFAGTDGGTGSASAGGGGCLIATAAYGSYLDPHVNILREFRDEYLLTNKAGRIFVGLYDRYSPPVADYIAEHGSLRAITRVLLLPLVGFGAFMLKITLVQKMLVMMISLILFTGIYVTIRRKRLEDSR